MIGDLSRRLTLVRPDRADDSGGGFAATWTDVATVWAAVSAAPAGESAATDDRVARVAYAIRIRWRDDVRPGWRARLDGRTADVVSVVDEEGAKRWLHLVAEEEIR